MTADPFDAALTGFERRTATTIRKLSADPLVHAMAAGGVDLDDQAAVDRWISSYNGGLPGIDYEEEDEDDVVDLKEAFGLPDEMAPLRLPVPEELAAMARHAPLMAQLRKL